MKATTTFSQTEIEALITAHLASMGYSIVEPVKLRADIVETGSEMHPTKGTVITAVATVDLEMGKSEQPAKPETTSPKKYPMRKGDGHQCITMGGKICINCGEARTA